MKLSFALVFVVLGCMETVSAAGVVASGTFEGHYYEVYNYRKRGDQAAALAANTVGYCGKPGYLAAITSSAENDFIWGLIPNGESPWIGLSDKDVEGTFHWMNGEVSHYRNWAPNEPNDSRHNEDCVQMNFRNENLWNDQTCNTNSKKYGYVVEYPCEGPAPTCDGPTGYWWGDPHMVTFDGLKYDCQGRGEFVAIKSFDSDFFVQTRFMIGAGHGLQGQHDYPVTVTRSVVFNTGEPGVPDIQVDVPDSIVDGCPYTFYVNGQEVPNFFATGTGTNKVIASQGGGRVVIFRYTETGTRIEIDARLSKKNGCNMAFQVCLPKRRFEGERVIGLLGSPDDDQSNDWMQSDDGTALTVPSSRFDKLFQPAYDYCTQQWCIDNEGDSKFTYTDGRDFDYYNYCNNAYDDNGITDFLNNVPAEVVTQCGAENYECLLEGTAGDPEDAVTATEVATELTRLRLAPPPAEPAVDEQGTVQTDTQGNIVTEGGTPIVITPNESPLSVNQAATFGDPHIKTWTGERYDFHGTCDLVLLQNPNFNGAGMDIHIRSKKVQRWSYIASAVLRIGSETLEVMGSDNKYWINGMEGCDLKNGISGFAILHRVVSRQQEEFRVVLDEATDEYIVFSTFKDMVRVDIKSASSKNFGKSLGLLGTFVGGFKFGRDKKTVIEDNNAFGQEWQVLASEEMLFHVAEGPQAPEKCIIPSLDTIRRRLEESSITLDAAEIACSRVSVDDFDSCVFDVLAMNDRDVAGSY